MEPNPSKLIPNLKYKFSFNSVDPFFEFSNQNVWNMYEKPIQEYLNEKFEKHLNGCDDIVLLIPPFNYYMVDFNGYALINLNKPDFPAFISYEEIPLHDEKYIALPAEASQNKFANQDLVFFFSSSSNAEKCYQTNKEAFKNERVLFFKEFQTLKSHIDKKNKTLLVTSTTDFKDSVSHESLQNENIKALFLFQDKQTKLNGELRSNLKIITITPCFDAIDKSLSEFINENKMKYLKENVDMKAAHHFNSNEACISYFFNQIIFNLFKANKLSEQQSKDAFINYCINNYLDYGGTNDELQELLDCVIENKFKSGKVINWYTKQSFFHKLLNSVLRKDKIHEFFKIRYAINQLRDALINFEYRSETEFFVYRASRINKAELALFDEKLKGDSNVIQLIGFISTTLNKQTADVFGQESHAYKKPDEYVILYKIKADRKSAKRLFNIRSVSEIPNEDELLLSYDSFIKIDSVEKSNNQNFDFLVNCHISDFEDVLAKVDYKTQEITKHYNLNNHFQISDDFYLAYLLLEMRKNKELIQLLKNIQPKDKIEESFLIHYFASIYRDQGEFEESLKYYFKYLKLNDGFFEKENPFVVISYTGIAIVYHTQGKYEEALEYYFKGLKVSKEISNKDDYPEIASIYHGISDVYLIQEKCDEALKYSLKGLEIYEKTHGKNHPRSADSYNIIAKIYVKKGKYDEAFNYFSKSLDIYHSTFGKNHVRTADCYTNIAILYLHQAKYDESLKFYNKCIEITEATYGKNNINTAKSYLNISSVYLNQCKYDEALNYLLKGIEIYEITFGKNHPDIVTIYNNIAIIYCNKGKYDEALNYHFNSLEINEATFGKNHPCIATNYHGISTVYVRQRKWEEALKYSIKSIELREANLGKYHPDTATSYNNISNIYFAQGKYDEASKYYFICIEIFETIHGKNHPDTAVAYNNISNVYSNQGKYDEALKYLFKSLDINDATFGKNHPNTYTTSNNIANIFLKQEKYNEALKYLVRCQDIKEATLEKYSPDTASIYNNISLIYYNQRKYDEALRYCFKSLEINERILGKNHPETAANYSKISNIYSYQGKYDEALDYNMKSLEISKEINGGNHTITCNIYDNIAKLYCRQGKYDEAVKYLVKCQEIKEATLGKYHPDTLTISSIILHIKSLSIKNNSI